MKKILLFVLLLVPVFVYADCDNEKIVTLGKFASNIKYETEYSKSSGKYTVTFYNVVDGIYLEYNNQSYYRNEDNEVKISGLDDGITLDVVAYPSGLGCRSSLITFNIKLKYYNTFYNDSRCKKYIEEGCKVVYCTSQFLEVEPTEDLFTGAIKNTCGEPAIPLPEPEPEPTFFEKVLDFMLDYGIKFILIAGSLTGSILFFTNRYRKMKHGI